MAKQRTFINPTTLEKVTTSDSKEIKRYKACGWKESKSPKTYYAKGLSSANNYYN